MTTVFSHIYSTKMSAKNIFLITIFFNNFAFKVLNKKLIKFLVPCAFMYCHISQRAILTCVLSKETLAYFQITYLHQLSVTTSFYWDRF